MVARLVKAAVLTELALTYVVVMGVRVDDDAAAHDPVETAISDVKMAEEEFLGQRNVMEIAAASHSKAVEQVRMADDLNRRARDMAMAKGALESEAVASREAAARDTAIAVARHEATKVSEAKAKRAAEAIAFAAKKAADTVAAKAYADKTKAEAEEACITSNRMGTQANLMTAEAARQKSEYERVSAAASDAKAQAKMAVMEKDAAKANLARICDEDSRAAVKAPAPELPGQKACGDAATVASVTDGPCAYSPVVKPAITEASTLQASPADGAAPVSGKSGAVPVEVKNGLAEVGVAATTVAPASGTTAPQQSAGPAQPQQTDCGQQAQQAAAPTAEPAASGSGSGSGSSVAASASSAISKIQSWLR